jgi:hypothetical protein
MRQFTLLFALLPGCAGPGPGVEETGETEDDPGAFVEVAVGYAHACARTDRGNVYCWGPFADYEDFGQADPPDAKFSAIAASTVRTCGLTLAGDLECWGIHDGSPDMDYGQTVSAPGPFTLVTTGLYETCVIGEAHEVSCWGADPNPGATVTRPEVPALDVSVRGGGALLDESGNIACWGISEYGELDAPSGAFSSVFTGDFHACALDGDGAAVCWGEGGFGYIQPPPDVRFRTLAAGWQATCGITQKGALMCWGGNMDSDHALHIAGFEPEGVFIDVSLGRDMACAVREDGAVMCWGLSMELGMSSLPPVDDPAYASG